jgi:hypothetical protein
MRDLLLEVPPYLSLLLLLALVVLVISIASIIIIAIGILQNTRQLLRLSERRIHYLNEERYRLDLLREQYRLLEKTLEQVNPRNS